MDESEALKLLQKYRQGKCTDEELALLESWFIRILGSAKRPTTAVDYDAVEHEIWQQIKPVPVRIIPLYIRYAAAVLLLLGIAFTYYFNSHYYQSNQNQTAQNILPGRNAATLTLANGKTINLSHQAGTIADSLGMQMLNDTVTGVVTFRLASGSHVTKNVIENVRNENPDGASTIATPRGGQYQLILEDGTKVVLNASSTLQFSRLAAKERKVTLIEGEAYFNVAKDSSRPFLVKTKGQTIRVLGTHFNVYAYPNETMKTTLAEGSVEITSSSSLQKKLLKPNQQALLLSTGLFEVKQVDAADEMAWQKGFFRFGDIPVADAVRQICRWYDIEADYASMPDVRINALLSTKLTLAELITGLEYSNSNIKITMKERRLHVRQVK